MIRKYVKLLRPKHYIKNLLVFVPLFFAEELFVVDKFVQLIYGFILFSFASSMIYIINDIRDCERDRHHPTKCNRPIASGAISKRNAMWVAIALSIVEIGIVYVRKMPLGAVLWLGLYILLNLLYSCGMKDIAVVDVFILAAGFVIRVLFAGSLVDIKISNWLFLTVFVFALYFGLGKRRGEYKTSRQEETRAVMGKYTYEYLDKHMYVLMALGLVFYSLWALEKADLLVWSIPIVILICMIYNFDLEKNSDGDPVTTLFENRGVMLVSLCYVVLMFVILYVC